MDGAPRRDRANLEALLRAEALGTVSLPPSLHAPADVSPGHDELCRPGRVLSPFRRRSRPGQPMNLSRSRATGRAGPWDEKETLYERCAISSHRMAVILEFL